ncbi:hypothetical protein [Endozoicomonas sp.]|uniref:hypothetical protein n=1 Tax=Endozoicomonas sp. TaxID=1892382 RepID=UPI003AF6DE36
MLKKLIIFLIIFTSFYVSASGVYQEKDYQCGTIIVELLDKWSIKEVVMTYGHVQNQFQFERIENLYKPLRKNTKFLQIKQQSDYFIFSNPITFFLTVHDGTHESSFDIQQSTCNDFKLGKASVKLTSGQPIPFLIQESKRDTTSSFSDHIDSAYFTPTYILMPFEGNYDKQ